MKTNTAEGRRAMTEPWYATWDGGVQRDRRVATATPLPPPADSTAGLAWPMTPLRDETA